MYWLMVNEPTSNVIYKLQIVFAFYAKDNNSSTMVYYRVTHTQHGTMWHSIAWPKYSCVEEAVNGASNKRIKCHTFAHTKIRSFYGKSLRRGNIANTLQLTHVKYSWGLIYKAFRFDEFSCCFFLFTSLHFFEM